MITLKQMNDMVQIAREKEFILELKYALLCGKQVDEIREKRQHRSFSEGLSELQKLQSSIISLKNGISTLMHREAYQSAEFVKVAVDLKLMRLDRKMTDPYDDFLCTMHGGSAIVCARCEVERQFTGNMS